MRSKPTRFAPLLIVLAIVAAWPLASSLLAQTGRGQTASAEDVVNGHRAAANEVLVKFARPETAAERAQTAALVDADRDVDLTRDGVRQIHSRRFDAATLVNFFERSPNVEYAEPNYLVDAIVTPTDPFFGNLWGLVNTGQTIGQSGVAGADIDAAPAWDLTTGSTANVVGVVDTGVDYNHPDLAGNIWSAPGSFTYTIAGQSIACAAGTHGFRSINGVMTCDPLDDHNHGTHVSGTIGALANNGQGVAGVNWTASIMGLKFLSASGSGSTADAVNVIEFAIQAKAHFGASANVRVLSNSWGGGGFSTTLSNEIAKANTNDMLFVAAAGNNGTDNDTSAFYPANYTNANVVAVAATDNRDNRASFSNYGATTVDLGAPGVNVYSTIRNNSYAYYSGTSMATPHVSGAAALVLSRCSLNTAGLRSAILNNTDAIAALAGITVTGGRLNVYRALTSCIGGQNPPQPPPSGQVPAAPTNLTASSGPGKKKISLTWNASAGATSYRVQRRNSSNQFVDIATVTGTSYQDTGLANRTTYAYVVIAVNSVGSSAPSTPASATTQ